MEVGGDPGRNMVASEKNGDGDVDAVIADCDEVFEHTYHMRAFNQAMMETSPPPGVQGQHYPLPDENQEPVRGYHISLLSASLLLKQLSHP